MIELMIQTLRAVESRFASRGIAVAMVPPPPEDRNERRALRIDAESDRALAQIILWESGELDLVIGDACSGDVLVDEHREVSSAIGIEDALAAIERYLAVADRS